MDPSLWTDDITLTSIVRFGGEALGNLVVGEPSYQQLIRHRTAAPLGIEDSKRSEAYPALAQAAIDGDLPGSSAGGEQPKFLAIIGEGESVRHALIKFSPHPDTPAGRRWFDLLLCEHLAACTLNDHGVPAARTALLETGGRLFLESTRFDRVGTQGRRGLFSLFSLSAAYYGRVDEPWKNLAKPLVWDDWISSEDAHRLRFMWRFGTLIGNSDMHHGNASFLWDGGARLTLAPSYDMLPMLYAPSPTGELVEHRFEPPVPEHDEHTIWNEAATLAVTFWQRVEAENRVSKGFRKTASENIVAIQKLQSRL